MDRTVQAGLAKDLLALHRPGSPVVLINAWDVVSATVIERAGARAIATTSAGVAWTLGYPDGEHIPREEMLMVVERIARAVSVPVTADLEAGYGATAGEVAETVTLAIGAGAVGMNLEDADSSASDAADPLFATEAAVERVAAARAAARASGLPFVINARTDVFLAGVGDPATRLRRAVDRVNAYRAAGADSLFVPGVRDAETIAALAREVDGPLNVLAAPGGLSVSALAALGVARISVGAGAIRNVLAAAARDASAVFATGELGPMMDHALTFADVNALVGRGGRTRSL